MLDGVWTRAGWLITFGKSDVVFVLLSTECRVMKGAKAQRGAKSPGPIKRSKSPAESSEPINIIIISSSPL